MDCCICYDKTIYACKTACGHLICVCCLYKMVKTECPICRASLEKDMPHDLKIKIKMNYRKIYPDATTVGVDIRDWDQFPPLGR